MNTAAELLRLLASLDMVQRRTLPAWMPDAVTLARLSNGGYCDPSQAGRLLLADAVNILRKLHSTRNSK